MSSDEEAHGLCVFLSLVYSWCRVPSRLIHAVTDDQIPPLIHAQSIPFIFSIFTLVFSQKYKLWSSEEKASDALAENSSDLGDPLATSNHKLSPVPCGSRASPGLVVTGWLVCFQCSHTFLRELLDSALRVGSHLDCPLLKPWLLPMEERWKLSGEV